MVDYQVSTPVAFLVFNRPETTRRVFDAIAKVQPPKLLVVADGPRADRPEDVERCAAVRAVIEKIDWQCELLTNYAETNLGLRKRISSGLEWVFEQVEEAIILEDDCLPDPTFFPYCDELLARYRDDERVMAVTGGNYQFGQRRTPYSYYFSRYPHVWGWASWRRAWQFYDAEMQLWPEVRDDGWLDNLLEDWRSRRYWRKIFDATFDGRFQTWDYQWTFALWVQRGLAIIPEQNLVANIGYHGGGVHASTPDKFADMAAPGISFPLQHPSFVMRNILADRYTQNKNYDNVPYTIRILSRLRHLLRSLLGSG